MPVADTRRLVAAMRKHNIASIMGTGSSLNAIFFLNTHR
jgi:hypothetical protein